MSSTAGWPRNGVTLLVGWLLAAAASEIATPQLIDTCFECQIPRSLCHVGEIGIAAR